jgi:hypothetical protein
MAGTCVSILATSTIQDFFGKKKNSNGSFSGIVATKRISRGR